MSQRLRKLYPQIEPYHRGRLRVSELHELYFEECGNPNGKPVVILHGGPGGGIAPFLRRSHDPARYRIILFDQRGAGQSTPAGEIRDNTTWDLVADIEALRLHLGIGCWQVVGGSWGSTLALCYALCHPERVSELIVRGIFALRQTELSWFYQHGAGMILPEAFARYQAPIAQDERHDMIAAYHRRLTGPAGPERQSAAIAWSAWEGAALALLPEKDSAAGYEDAAFAESFARIECHYFHNRGWLAHDGWLLEQAHRLQDIPGVIIQGRYDLITPADTALALHAAWPQAQLKLILDAGHTGMEPGIQDAMVRASDRFATPAIRRVLANTPGAARVHIGD